MKTFKIAAVALLAALTTASVSCSSGDKSNDADSTKNVTGTKQAEAYETNINIRYVDMDSLMKHYDLAVEKQAELEALALELQQYQNELGRGLQTRQAAIQQKLQSNGYLSEASYKADVEEYQRAEQNAGAQYARREQAAQARINDINKTVNDAIQSYIIEYNKDKKYDAILHKEVGLYFNPALDITGELVAGLNKAYKEKKQSENADAKKDDVAAAKK